MSSTLFHLLPGLCYLLVAGLAAAAVHRWYEPLSRAVAVGWVGLPAAVFAPVLFAGRVLLPLGVFDRLPPFAPLADDFPRGNLLQSDLVLEGFPWLHAVRRAVTDGHWPLLDALSSAGTPLLGNSQSQALQPLVWLASPLPLVDAVGVVAALRVFAALFFTYLLFARLGFARPAAVFAAVSYGLGGFTLLWLGWPLANSAAWMPAVLYAVALVAQRGRRRDGALLAFAFFALLTGGHPETILHALLLSAVFALALWLRLPAARRWPTVLSWAAAAALAGALAAPVLIPPALYLPQSYRAVAVAEMRQNALSHGWFDNWSPRHPGVRRRSVERIDARLAAQVAPGSLGNNRFGDYWGVSNVNGDASGFAGSLALVGALAGLGFGLRRRPGERAMAALAVVTAALTLQVPGSVRLLFSLPLLDRSVTAHGRLRLVLAFALAYLAAASLDRWLAGETTGRRWAVAALAVSGLVTWAYLAHPPPAEAADQAPLHAASALVQAAVLGLMVITLGLATRRREASAAVGERRRVVAAGVLVVLAAGELLFFFLPANPPMPRWAAYPSTPEIEYLQQQGGGDASWRVVGLHGALLSNLPTVYGLAGPGSSNPLKPAAYADLLAPLLPRSYGGPDRFVVSESPLYDLLGVRYVMAPYGPRQPRGTALRLRGPGARVWERPHPLPLLFLPAAAEPCRGRWSDCVAEVADFAAEARVEPGGPVPAGWRATRPESELTLERGAAPVRHAADAFLLEPRLLASSLYQDGGWRLLVDGEPHPTLRADGPFVAAWLPAGRHRMELLYRSPGLLAGAVAAALGLVFAVAWLLAPPRRFRVGV